MAAETKQEKAARYVAEGRVRPGRRCYYVTGATGVWTVTRRPDKSLRCSCPVTAKQECSHRLAVLLYREQTMTRKTTTTEEAKKTMAAENGTKMVAASQTVAMTPQVAPQEPVGDELEALWNISERLSKCGMFRTRRKQWNPQTRQQEWVDESAPAEDVFMIVLSGRDFGLSAAASSRHLKMIKGALSISAEIMRARLHQYGYEYDVEVSDEKTTFAVTGYNNESKQQTGPAWAEMTLWRRADPATKWVVRYETSEAVQAGLTKNEGGWDKNPGDMLVARVTTRAVRRYAPEVLNKTYLPEELGFYEGDDGQGGTRLVSVAVDDGDAQEEAQTAPEAVAEQSNATPPPAAKKTRTRKPAPATETPAAAPPHDPDTGEVFDGVFEPGDDEPAPGKTQRLAEPEPPPVEPDVTNLDLDDEDDDDEPPAAEPAPAPPPAAPKAAKPKPAPEPDPEPEVAADQLAYLPDGSPANEATRQWEADHAPAAEAVAPAEEPAAEPAPAVSDDEAKFYESAGALRTFLVSKGIVKGHDKFKEEVGYGDVPWQSLDEEQRVCIYMAARDGLE